MEGFKEFEGKSLDLAIREACEYYNAVREKLEIEIVQDAKSGIFGLVGARKAKIRARRAALREVVATALGRAGQLEAEAVAPPAAEETAPRTSVRPSRGDRAPSQRTEAAPAAQRRQRAQRKSGSRTAGSEQETADTGQEVRNTAAPAEAMPAPEKSGRTGGRRAPVGADTPPVADAAEMPLDSFEAAEDLSAALVDIDPERLATLTTEVVTHLVRPIAGDAVELKAEVQDGRVRVSIDGVEDSGLLIGREGQTLAALQYLASRIMSRAVNAPVRVQLDAGRYRQRQDEKLREIALALAERVRQTGRSFSTRPLSSYHRRIVHLALQDAPDVQTRSTGDGPLKRVVVCRRRPDRGQD